MNKKYFGGILAISGGFLTGCATTDVDRAIDENKRESASAESLMKHHSKVSKSSVQVEMSDEYHIVGKKFNKEDRQILPSFFRESYSFQRVDPVTFSELISYLNKETNVRLDLTDDAQKHIKSLVDNAEESDSDEGIEIEEDEASLDMSVNAASLGDDNGSGLAGSDLLFSVEFSGTLEEFLNHILGRVDLSWEWKNNRIDIFHTTEKTFVIDADFSDINFDASMTGGSGSTQSYGMSNAMGSIYDDLESVIGGLLSDSGSMSISKHSSTVTVTDTPSRIEKISRYLDQVNKIAGKQVMMNVQIIDVQSDESGDYGIDWEAVYSNSSRIGAGLSTDFLPGTDSIFEVVNIDGGFSGSRAMINALSKKGNASTTINTNIYTTNGRPAPLNIGRTLDYPEYEPIFNQETDELARLVPTISDNPLETGIKLSIIPRITSSGDVSMTMAMDISDGEVIKEVDTGIPLNIKDQTYKSFIQQAISRNGESIMLAGFERTNNDATQSALGEAVSWLAGGSKSSNKTKTMSVIVITPYIMK